MDDVTPQARRLAEGAEDWEGRLIDDLHARQLRGARVPVETYVQQLPDLAAESEIVQNLLLAEWTLRRAAGETVELAEYIERFPKWEAEMRLLWESDRQAARADDKAGAVVPWPHWYTDGAELPVEFGSYLLLQEFGGGGMGRVFLAEPLAGGDRVVVKVPKFLMGQDPQSVAKRRMLALRFEREARLTQELHHPQLCHALAIGECNGLPYFVMPYYPGGSLADELQVRGRFDERAAAGLIAEAARALQYAHERDILHRDLKPSNLLRDRQGKVIVTDFGLALPLDADESRLTPSGHLPGTWRYLSPEQMGGKDLGPASDLFSLGAVLYELLAGQPAFPGEPLQLVQAIMEASPLPLKQLRPDLSPTLAEICRIAMAREPGERYASMAEFAAALENFLDPSRPPPHEKTPPTLPPVPVRRGRPSRPRWAAAVLAGGGVLLLVWTIVALWASLGDSTQRGPQRDPPAKAERPVVSTRKPVGIRGHLQAMHDDLARLDAVKDRPHVRYFSLMAVHDNPYFSDDDLNLHLVAMRRVLNRLSRNQGDVGLFPVDAALLRVDLRDLGWATAHEWAALLKVEPYGVRYDGQYNNPDEPLRKLALDTCDLAGVKSLEDRPSVRADWFIEAATHGPLFDFLFKLDGTDRRHPPFDLEGADNALARVVRLYGTNDVDTRVAAAELGLGTVAEVDARWPADRLDLRNALAEPLSRRRWVGEEGHALFKEYVKTLKLGVPRATQALR